VLALGDEDRASKAVTSIFKVHCLHETCVLVMKKL